MIDSTDLRLQPLDQTPPPAVDPVFSKNAESVLAKRYLIRDKAGVPVESSRDLFWRVARFVALADARYGASPEDVQALARRFYEMMVRGEWEPNSPTLMNAGRPLGQLSACFVLPVDDALHNGKSGIYDTLTSMARIHQSGGGCISGDARVWTTFCGVEPLEVLFNRATADGRQGVASGAGTSFDVRDLDIQTMSMDPANGQTGLKAVTHLWKFDVGAESQIVVRTQSGTEVQTSDWHPFMVLRDCALVEVRADAMRVGDIILGPERPDRMWPWSEERTVSGLRVGPGLAWLAGFTVTNSLFDYVPAFRRQELSWPSRSVSALDRVQKVLLESGVSPSMVERRVDGRGATVVVFDPAFIHSLHAVCAIGPDGFAARVPEYIGKSPLDVVRAFLAGLLDGRSESWATGNSLSYATASEDAAQDMAALLGLMGYSPTVSSKGGGVLFDVQMCKPEQKEDLLEDLAPFLSSIQTLGSNEPVKQSGVRISTTPWRDALRRHDLTLGEIPGRKLGESGPEDLLGLAEALSAHEPALGRLLHRAVREGQQVCEVSRAQTPKAYYDMSVDEWNTYAAGRNGMVMIHNTGFSFSRIRPKGSIVRSTTGVASGPISFMEMYNASTEVVKQGGTRRGANMGILRVDHPDILDFIHCKDDITRITNFNISVAITDSFMDSVAAGTKYDLVNPVDGTVTGQLDAVTVFQEIVDHAWKTGEPGIFFIDRANRFNPVPALGAYESTNPCGEQNLLPFDVCNLGSLNLDRFIDDTVPAERPWEERIRWDAMRAIIHLSTRFLDNVIDMNTFPLPEIQDLARQIRRIGNGVMGYADALIRLGIPYGSDEGVVAGRKIAQFFYEECQRASQDLARERGVFPAWSTSIWGPNATCARAKDGSRVRPMLKLRNCNVNTVAPTGTISIIAGCSSGIEPLFAVAFMRNQAGMMMPDVNPEFVRQAKAGGWYSEGLMARIAQEGSVHLPEVPLEIQRVFATTHDITPEYHVRHQAAWQEFVDSSISKTTNFPNSATREDVRQVYELAYRLGCKGVTVYRDGSRDNQVLSTGATKSSAPVTGEADRIAVLERELANSRSELAQERHRRRTIRPRARALRGATYQQESPLGKMYVTINHDEAGEPFELFALLGKAGGSAAADVEAMARLCSLALRAEVSLDDIYKELRGISSDRAVGVGPRKVLSVPDAIAQAIKESMAVAEGVQEELPLLTNTGGTPLLIPAPGDDFPGAVDAKLEVCDECRSPAMEFSEGCLKCHVCGASKCG